MVRSSRHTADILSLHNTEVQDPVTETGRVPTPLQTHGGRARRYADRARRVTAGT